jgi:MFS family permease
MGWKLMTPDRTLTRTATPINTPRQVLFASLIGTSIEFFDFYIYATAAVLVFPRLFFPASDPASSTLASLATFGIAFLARPVGSALFGHFGDRIGRKKTLVLALLTMGLSTVLIGALPTYQSIGVLAPLALAICRFGQGLGLGGEWGGAVLLAIENAPPSQRAWYVSAAGRADRLSALGQRLPGTLAPAERHAVLRLRVAAAVSGELGAGAGWALCTAHNNRDSNF